MNKPTILVVGHRSSGINIRSLLSASSIVAVDIETQGFDKSHEGVILCHVDHTNVTISSTKVEELLSHAGLSFDSDTIEDLSSYSEEDFHNILKALSYDSYRREFNLVTYADEPDPFMYMPPCKKKKSRIPKWKRDAMYGGTK